MQLRITEWQQGGFLYLLPRCFLPFSCDRETGSSHLKPWLGGKKKKQYSSLETGLEKEGGRSLINEVVESARNEVKKCSQEDKHSSFSSPSAL